MPVFYLSFCRYQITLLSESGTWVLSSLLKATAQWCSGRREPATYELQVWCSTDSATTPPWCHYASDIWSTQYLFSRIFHVYVAFIFGWKWVRPRFWQKWRNFVSRLLAFLVGSQLSDIGVQLNPHFRISRSTTIVIDLGEVLLM